MIPTKLSKYYNMNDLECRGFISKRTDILPYVNKYILIRESL